MTIATQAGTIVEDFNGTHVNGLFDVVVDIYSQVKNNDVTYVRLSRGKEHGARGNYKFLCEIPIYHPFDVEINESNWASYLYLNLYVQEDGMKKVFKHLPRCNLQSIKSYPTIGRFYFEINTGSELIALIVDRPAKARVKYRNHPNGFIVSHPNSQSTSKNQVLAYNNRGIMITNQNELVVDDGSYFAHRRDRLTPKEEVQFILDGVDNHLFGTDYFLGKEEYEHSNPHSLDRALIPYRFDDFEYFKSVDGKVIITLQKNPVEKAFRAIQKVFEKLSANKTDPSITDWIQERYTRLVVEYVIGRKGSFAPTVNNTQNTLKAIIEQLIETQEFSEVANR